jgi:hypothetical protein
MSSKRMVSQLGYAMAPDLMMDGVAFRQLSYVHTHFAHVLRGALGSVYKSDMLCLCH